MTREQRCIKLKNLIICMKCEASGKECDENCSTQYKAGNMGEIIENLEAISEIIEQQSCGDCISRQAAKLKVARVTWDDGDSCYDFHDKCVDCLDDLPSVTPKQQTAEWYKENVCEGACEGYMSAGVICSQCGEVFCGYIGDYDFCPNCGARMEVEE